MKASEILEKLEKGELLKEQKNMKFKYGRLERGVTKSYYIGDEPIKKNQFEAVRGLVKEIEYELGTSTYKLKKILENE